MKSNNINNNINTSYYTNTKQVSEKPLTKVEENKELNYISNSHSIDNSKVTLNQSSTLILQSFDKGTSSFIKEIVPSLEQAYLHFLQNDFKDTEVVLVCGDTGAGKSTLINYISGEPIQIIQLKNIKLPVLDCKTGITEIGHDKESKTSNPKRCEIGKMVFWDCPGFEDTSGAAQDIVNAYSVTKIKGHAQNIKILVVVEESSIIGTRRGQAFKDMIVKLDKMFGSDPRLLNATVLCFTKAYNVEDYGSELLKTVKEKSELNSFQREFLYTLVKNKSFVVCPNPEPKDLNTTYPNFYGKNLVSLIQQSTSLNDPEINPVISPKSLLPINELREYANNEIKQNLENILVVVSKGFKSETFKESLSRMETIFSIKNKYDNNPNMRDIEMIVELQSVVDGDDTRFEESFKSMKFLSTEVLEEIVGKFIPTANKIEFATITEPFIEFSRNSCKFLMANGWSKEDAFSFIKDQKYTLNTMSSQQKYGHDKYLANIKK